MQRLFRFALLTGLTLLLLLARAHDLRAQGGSGISYPPETEVVRGVITIVGSAQHPDFWKYELAAAPAGTQNWFNIGVSETPVNNGALGQWDTATVGDGAYALRLRVVRRDGNFDEFFTQRVQVANTQPVATPTPAETPTPTITPTSAPPTATPVVITPEIPTATPAPAVTAVSTAEAQASPQADGGEGEEEVGENSLATLGAQASTGFMRGVRAVLLVFVTVGIFFAIKNALTWLYYRFLA